MAQPRVAASAGVRPRDEAAQEPGGERVTAAGGVDDLDSERRDAGLRRRVDQERPVGAGGRGDATGAELDELAAAVDQVGRAGEAEHLLVVRQHVVEVREGRRDPVEQAGLAGRQEVRRRHDAVLAGEGQDLRGGLAAHELRSAQVQVGRGRRSRPTAHRRAP